MILTPLKVEKIRWLPKVTSVSSAYVNKVATVGRTSGAVFYHN